MNNYANRIQRILNFVIDLIIISGLMVTIILLFFSLISKKVIDINSITEDRLNTVLGIIIYSTIFLYYYIFELLFNKTLGKIITRTGIVDVLNNKPKPKQILIRSLIRLIPIDWFTYFSKQPVGWHDSASGTRVKKIKK